MDTVLEQLLAIAGDRVIIAIILALGVTVGVLLRLFIKQRQFIRERLEVLRQENQDLRKELRTENEAVKSLAGQIPKLIGERLDHLGQEQQDFRREHRMAAEGVTSLSGQVQTMAVGFRERSSLSETALQRLVDVETGVLPGPQLVIEQGL